MLNSATPFPQVGSYALLEEGRETHLVRIQRRTAGTDECVISIVGREGATGNRTVLVEDLTDGTALTADEQREMDSLASKFGCKAITRYEELRTRFINARALDRRLAAIGAYQPEAA